ncbi:MAG: T9SS type A sorting domain-containing protein [Candidatus Zixiibacteriota bacterium]
MRIRLSSLLIILILSISLFAQVNGTIIEQDLDASGHGYSIARFWGSHYEMGYAYGYLFADEIYNTVLDIYGLIASMGYSWEEVQYLMSTYTYKPDYIEEEFQAIADGVNDARPGSDITGTEVKAFNLFGDIAYACRSVSSWGSTTAESEFTTISTRRLDYSDMGIDAQNHHMIAIFQPEDGSPDWINFGWPGFVTVVTAVNEYGTLSSLHDFYGSGTVMGDALPRVLAARWILCMEFDEDISTHAAMAFDSLSGYMCPTGGFLNYYVPDGHGGVISHNYTAGFHDLRRPNSSCYLGQAIYTNNSIIDGSYVGEPWTGYYESNASSGMITMDGQWDVSGPSFHRLTIGVRERGDNKIWFEGQQPVGNTPRIELEWAEIMSIEEKQYTSLPDNYDISAYPNPFNSVVNISMDKKIQNMRIYDMQGNLVFSEFIDDKTYKWQPASELESGVYLVNAISQSNLNSTQTIIYLK